MDRAIEWFAQRQGKVSYSMINRNGSASYDCLPLDKTELLTPTGWKPLKDFKVGDDIIQYNKDTNTLSKTEVRRVVEPYEAEVFKRGDFEATDSHRVLYKTRKTNYIREALWSEIKDSYSVIMPEMTTLSDKQDTELNKISDDEFKLLIAIQADGHYKKLSNSDNRKLHFHLSKERKINALLDILENIGIDYSIYDKLKDNTAQITINDTDFIDNFCEKFLTNKSFNEEWLKISYERALLLSEEIYKWDGSDYGQRKLFGSTNEKDVDLVQAILTINGIKTMKRKIVDDRSEKYSDYFTLTYSLAPRYSLGEQKSSRTTMVSCVSVDSTYIVARVNGTPFITGNCSSAIYHALIYAGILPQGFRIGNTETLFVDLPKFGFQRIEADANGYIPTQRGDIFLWGKQGQTAGANGHVGIYIDSDNIIHCSYGYNGIHIDNHDWLAGINNVQYLTIFRYTGKAQPAPAPAPEAIDDVINVGSHFKFNQTFIVVETHINDGRKEVRINELCPTGFTWEENGVPADWLVKVDNDGYRIGGEINTGDSVKIEGAFVAQEVVQNANLWFAKVNRGGVDVWVELTPTTEIPAGEFGTRIENRPAPAPQSVPAPVEQPKPEVKEEPKPIEEPKPEVKEEPKPETKEEKVAEKNNELPKINERPFTKEELKVLEDSKQEAVKAIEALNEDEQFNELKELIPKPVRLGLYLFGDLLLIGSAVIASYGIGFTQAGMTGGIVGALSAGGAGIIAMAKLTKKK